MAWCVRLNVANDTEVIIDKQTDRKREKNWLTSILLHFCMKQFDFCIEFSILLLHFYDFSRVLFGAVCNVNEMFD